MERRTARMCLISKVIESIKADPAGVIIGVVVALACLSALVEFWSWIGGVQ